MMDDGHNIPMDERAIPSEWTTYQFSNGTLLTNAGDYNWPPPAINCHWELLTEVKQLPMASGTGGWRWFKLMPDAATEQM